MCSSLLLLPCLSGSKARAEASVSLAEQSKEDMQRKALQLQQRIAAALSAAGTSDKEAAALRLQLQVCIQVFSVFGYSRGHRLCSAVSTLPCSAVV